MAERNSRQIDVQVKASSMGRVCLCIGALTILIVLMISLHPPVSMEVISPYRVPMFKSIKKNYSMDVVTPSFATEADVQDIWEFMSGDFLENESLNLALQMKKEDSRGLFFYLIRKGVSSGTSVLLRNEKGTIVGLRLSSFLDRDAAEESDEDEENLQFSQKAEVIDGLLANLGEARWDRIPKDVSRVFYIIVISVHTSYTRRGLGKVLLEFGMDKAREARATGILSEATAMKSQALFAKHGYRILKEIKHEDHVDKDGKRIFMCPDGTSCAQLVFRYVDN